MFKQGDKVVVNMIFNLGEAIEVDGIKGIVTHASDDTALVELENGHMEVLSQYTRYKDGKLIAKKVQE